MPTYVYKCNDCDYQFEVRQRMSDDPLTDCPECVEGDVRRVINSVGVVFKGSGFYVTDTRGGKNGASRNGSSSSESKTETTNSEAETGSTKKEEKKEKVSSESVH